LKTAPKITEKDDYLLVEPEAVNYWEIWECICAELSLPQFPEKNDIWVFQKGPVKLTYVDLYRLKEFIQDNYPKTAKRNKTALVVETDIQAATAEFFIQIAEDLPFEIKIFTDFHSAEDWIISN